jgi:uncharacterized protein YjeT (DUF2065 family)
VRKLWIARALVVIAAAGLGAVVIEEQREQMAEDQAQRSDGALRPVSERSDTRPAAHLRVDGNARPLTYSMMHPRRPVERRPAAQR